MNCRFLLAGLLLGGLTLAAAEKLDDVTVTALVGRKASVTGTPGGVSVVTQEDLFLDTPISLSDMSLRLPGVSKSSDAHWGSELNIRGMTRNRIVFILDGIRVNTATDVGIQFGLVLPQDIERIEILKGPVSELYGSGSLGGVVNVTTKGASFTENPEVHGGTTLSAGSNPSGFASYGRLSYSSKDFWLFVSGGYRDYDSYKDGSHEEVPNSYMEDSQLSLKGGYKWTEGQVTSASYSHYRATDVGVPGGEGLPGAASRVVLPVTTMDSYTLTHKMSFDDGIWAESDLQAYYQKIDRAVSVDRFNYSDGAGWPRPNHLWPSAVHETYGLRWNNILELDPHTVVWGLDAWRWEYTGDRLKKVQLPNQSYKYIADTPMADSRQDVLGIFLEDDWKLNDVLTLNIGARADRIWAKSDDLYGPKPAHALLSEDADMEDWSWSAHAGLTWKIDTNWSATALLSRANRVPDLMDRFKYISLSKGVLYGNPDLDSEHSYYGELGVHYLDQVLRASASLYASRVSDLVAACPIEGTDNQRMENVDKVLIKGAELEIGWKFLPDWEVYGYIAWMEGDDLDDDVYLRDNQPLNGLLGISYKAPAGWWARLEANWAGEQDHNAPGYDECDAWCTFNAQAGYSFTWKGVKNSIVFTADNMLNAQYVNYLSTIRGNNSDLAYQEPGRNFVLAWQTEW